MAQHLDVPCDTVCTAGEAFFTAYIEYTVLCVAHCGYGPASMPNLACRGRMILLQVACFAGWVLLILHSGYRPGSIATSLCLEFLDVGLVLHANSGCFKGTH
jgi:hypothetical protein